MFLEQTRDDRDQRKHANCQHGRRRSRGTDRRQSVPLASSTCENEDELWHVFSLYDKAGGGQLTIKNILSVIKEYGIKTTRKDVAGHMHDMGIQGDVTFGEFCTIVSRIRLAANDTEEEELLEAFRIFGGHMNGHISKEQFQEGLELMGVSRMHSPQLIWNVPQVELEIDEMHNLFEEADQDTDGLLNFEEWKRVLADRKT